MEQVRPDVGLPIGALQQVLSAKFSGIVTLPAPLQLVAR